MAKERFDVYQMITDKIITQLEAGKNPWRQPWMALSGSHQNLVSRKPYRGINAVMTMMSGFASPFWVTFKQAQALGGHVKKGEHGTPVVFWNIQKREKRDKTTGVVTEERIPFIKYYTIFNVEQCEGLEVPTITKPTVAVDEAAEAAIKNWSECPKIFHGGDRAYYAPLTDEVHVPVRDAFHSTDAYYGTLFHELIHSTGSDSRLCRFKPNEGQFIFGSESYSQEELVAEIGSAFVAGRLGVKLDEENSAAYLRSWLKRLKSDKKFIFTAARDAQKAADRILGEAVVGEDEQGGNGDAVQAAA